MNHTINNVLKYILVALLLGLFAVFLLHPLNAINQDLGRYFKVSEIIFETGGVPNTNLFSYTNTDFGFINTHWLGGVVFYALSLVIGLKGLIVFKTLLILLSFFIVFYLALKISYYKKIDKKNFWLVFLVSLPIIGILMERTDVRPEIFSFLFISVFIYILYDYREGSKALWILPVLQLLWVNIHIYFFLGPLIFLFFFVDKIFQQKTRKELRKLLIIGCLLALVVFINPNGIAGVFYPITAMGDYGYTIVENQTPFFLMAFNYHKGIVTLFFLVSFFLLVSFLLNYKKLRIFELLLVGFFCFFGMYAIRNFPVLALVALPVLSRNLSEHWFRFMYFLKKFFVFKKTLYFEFCLLSMSVFCISILIYANADQVNLHTGAKAQKAVDFLIENNIKGKMFNNFDVGGYLIYRLYPETKVFVDNRPEAYPVSFFRDIYKPMQEDKLLWEKYSEEYAFDFIFFEHTDMTPWAISFFNMIVGDEKWEKVYYDNSEAIFVKKKHE